MVENDMIFRKIFRYFNKILIFKWKLGLARWINIWPHGFGRFMVITHSGRKSGKKYQTPINYAVLDGEIYCVAGFGHQSDWYQNILKNPSIEIWLKEGWWAGEAKDISNDPNRTAIMREVLIGSGFAAPLFGIHHTKMDDETLDQLTQPYRLVRIKRTRERTGRKGPDEYTWVWPIATIFLFLLLTNKRKNK